jgi:hypothetical protein
MQRQNWHSEGRSFLALTVVFQRTYAAKDRPFLIMHPLLCLEVTVFGQSFLTLTGSM